MAEFENGLEPCSRKNKSYSPLRADLTATETNKVRQDSLHIYAFWGWKAVTLRSKPLSSKFLSIQHSLSSFTPEHFKDL